jgi:hypothetical protein
MRIAVLAIAFLLIAACKKSEESEAAEYDPVINPADFTAEITNPCFPLTPGQTFIYEGGADSNEVSVTHETREVMGVTCVVVRDRVWVNRELEEETYDWYAQHQNGDVWYFGEISLQYDNGVVVSTEGSWEAGEDDAKPGIIMKAHPQIGDSYRQEFYEDEAEDMAEVLSLTDSVSVPYGQFTNCVKTKEWTPLEPGVTEHKFYAAGVGLLREATVEGGSGHSDLVAIRADSKAPAK